MVRMRRILPVPFRVPVHGLRRTLAVAFTLGGALQLPAQRATVVPDSATRAAIDEFTVTVRDMAAWAITKPAARIPVGGLLDAAGNVSSVVQNDQAPVNPPDSMLIAFRQALGLGARQRKSTAIGFAYLVRRARAGQMEAEEGVLVEVEHRNGYRANVLYPYSAVRRHTSHAVDANAGRAHRC
jgi:hypothetical protein